MAKQTQRKERAVSLGEEIAEYLGRLPFGSKGLLNHWQKVAPPYLLEHTDNVVYDSRLNSDAILVYVDSSVYAAELTMDKELYRLRMSQETGKDISDIRFLVSRKAAIRNKAHQDPDSQGRI